MKSTAPGAKGPKKPIPPSAIAWTGVVIPPGVVPRTQITPAEFAAFAGVSLRTARAWIAGGRVPVTHLSARTQRISVAAAERFVAGTGE